MDIKLDKIINKNDIKDHSIIVVKFKNDGYQDFGKIANQIGAMIKDKNDCFLLFMHESQSFDLLPEEEMNKRGWFKK